MAARLGWTVGATADDFVQKQCSAVLGLIPRDEEWLAGRALAGVWFATIEDSAAHQHSMDTAPYAGHAGVVVSPLATGRLDPPDVVLIYATPGQMVLMINGLQWSGRIKANPEGRPLRLGALTCQNDYALSLIHISEPTRPY